MAEREHPAPWRWESWGVAEGDLLSEDFLKDANGVRLLCANADEGISIASPHARALVAAAPEFAALAQKMVDESASYHFMPNIVHEFRLLLERVGSLASHPARR